MAGGRHLEKSKIGRLTDLRVSPIKNRILQIQDDRRPSLQRLTDHRKWHDDDIGRMNF